MKYRTFSLASGVLALLACLGSFGAGRVAAAVLPQARIDAALASAKKLRRKTSPDSQMPGLYYTLDGSDAEGWLDPTADDYGYLKNGTDVFIVPMESGGSGGVFYTLLFTSIATKPAFIGYVPSPAGHLEVHIDEGRLMVETPVYKGNDPNCCPSSHHVIMYTVNGTSLKQTDAFDRP